MPVLLHGRVQLRQQVVGHPRAGRCRDVVMVGDVVGEIVLVVRAVRHVIVEHEVRLPRGKQPQPRLHLRRVGFGVVAVQIQVLGGIAQARDLRAVLHGPVVGAAMLVAVDVEYRQHDKDGIVKPVALVRLVCHGHVANQHESCVLALNFAGVYAGLDQDDGFAGFVCGLRRKGPVAAHDQGVGGAVLRGLAHRYYMDEGAALFQQAHGAHGLVIHTRPVPAGDLARGEQIGWDALRRGGE